MLKAWWTIPLPPPPRLRLPAALMVRPCSLPIITQLACHCHCHCHCHCQHLTFLARHAAGPSLLAADAFGNDAFTSTPTTAKPGSEQEDDPFAQAALSPVTADSPLRQRSSTLPATMAGLPEPPLDAVGYQRVPACTDRDLLGAVKGVLRAERIKLWLPPHSSPVGQSSLEDEVVERIAALAERGKTGWCSASMWLWVQSGGAIQSEHQHSGEQSERTMSILPCIMGGRVSWVVVS